MIFFFISLSTYICFLVLKYQKGLKALDDQKFKLKDYGKWIKNNFKKLFLTPELLAIIVIAMAINTNAKVTGICMVIFYLLMFLYELYHKTDKMKLNKRLIMVIVTVCLIYALTFTAYYLDYLSLQDDFLIFDDTWLYYIVVIIMGYIAYYLIFFGALINRPFEILIKKLKGARAKNKQSHKLK